ncbi:MAG: diacylglycerol kinase [Betaproteobacteria bacterium CG2_30_59_46]|nr:MAG: diacylglycerol kinase [Betaproteobacteria bacterium CG2_30_59_46]PIQ12732.1 MAG: diacylglycerol kinase [Hydrogenophilales bacterium CG18_big_fil_WC_8_21_14_2_50_58_12]PIX99000.1 MAG: diacylglycerol kinase [Hydrogenophilales bacterium CG_4_10_14_3_um_filter_58_23]PJB08787.1 MAG: diacylglycerol kinase [Hydrogenophilales bacterium CG_4_9_14_3_um_filter_59_35]
MGKPRLSIIAAMAKNRTIGIDNTLPWRLPEDLKHFKALTLGHHILMGRKTWESLPGKLPGRTSVVITRSRDLQAPGCIVANSIEDAITACGGDDEVFFIGGAELYRQALDIADRLYLTEIQSEFKGDAWFPEFDPGLWRETGRKPCKSENGLECDFVVYDKKPLPL